MDKYTPRFEELKKRLNSEKFSINDIQSNVSRTKYNLNDIVLEYLDEKAELSDKIGLNDKERYFIKVLKNSSTIYHELYFEFKRVFSSLIEADLTDQYKFAAHLNSLKLSINFVDKNIQQLSILGDSEEIIAYLKLIEKEYVNLHYAFLKYIEFTYAIDIKGKER